MYVEWTYGLYLLISIALTVWVARTLHHNGRAFLVDAFRGNESLADSVNHLLVVGFYLINIGYVTLALKYGESPRTLAGVIESLSTKVGLVLVVLGAMHFGNLIVFTSMRRRAAHRDAFGNYSYIPPSAPPVVRPTPSAPPTAPAPTP